MGVLVQANHGRRERLRVDGVPVGMRLDAIPRPRTAVDLPPEAGSIIVVVATDAPLLPGQCDRLAQRSVLGIARSGGSGENSSGDLVLCFATGNRGLAAAIDERTHALPVTMLGHAHIDVLFDAVIDATEEAILNAMLAAGTMRGHEGSVAYGLDGDALLAALAPPTPG